MQSREALRVLAEVMQSQWGMVTSAQARARGVSHMNLKRLADAGDLVRLVHGVYRSASAPSGEHEELRASWLAVEPRRLAFERIAENPGDVVVSGGSATRLHGIGDLRAMVNEFTTPTRRQTQRDDVRFRRRVLPDRDIIVRDGLPVTTVERTIADLVENREDLTTVADALRDADRQSHLDMDHLEELLAPLAARNGHRKDDGGALLDELMQIAGIDLDTLAEQVATSPHFGALVTSKLLVDLQSDARAVIEQGDDPAVVAQALGTIARSGDSSELARHLGVGRVELDKALSAEGSPSFAAILKVARALGLTLHFVPVT